MDLRKERSGLPLTKDTQDTVVNFQKIKNAAKAEPTAANDMAMIFGYMKMLDPGSTVREGEYASAENARGIPGTIANSYNKLLKGERLTPAQRMEFLKSAQGQYQAQIVKQKQADQTYLDMAAKNGFDAKDVIVDFGMDEDKPKTREQKIQELKARGY